MIAVVALALVLQAMHAQIATDAAGARQGGDPHVAGTPAAANESPHPPLKRASPGVPEAALLEYLGEFDDAADGLDAMGLDSAEPPRRDAPAGQKEHQ